ncbi:MAG TPA: bifunctional salicylyl-CoA 5-hydroxylase/oxidoreductase, partial [Actinomycetota bacterium]|nr:bifunctional salicylyl-CoA 5-hydroxylase/oxidoreductase [Actinomycetota bacterium]
VAVSPDGRVTSGSPGLYEDPHIEAWKIVLPQGAAARLVHAGRRGATKPRHLGLDQPSDDGWPLIAPAAVAYGSNAVPREATAEDMERVVEDFAAAARRAAPAGFAALIVDCARGYLLGSFLSPATNRGSEEIEERAGFPLEVFDAVRREWRGPLGVSLNAFDGVRGGIDFDDVLWVARALREKGCDFVEVTAGGTTPASVVPYDPYTLPSYADRIRNEAGVPVLLGGAVSTVDRVNTLVASGRADLCAVMPPR